MRGEDFPQSAKNQRYVRFPRNFAWWSPWTCLTKENCKNRLLIDFRQRWPCISGISAEGWEFFAKERYLPLRGEDFLLRGDDFPLRGDDFPVRGEDFPLRAKNQPYVRFPRSFAWWSPWTCLTKEKCKNRLLIDFKQRRPCISGISAEEGRIFSLGEIFTTEGGGFSAEGWWFSAARGWFSGEGMIFRWGGRIFRRAPKINAKSDSHETLHDDPHGHA